MQRSANGVNALRSPHQQPAAQSSTSRGIWAEPTARRNSSRPARARPGASKSSTGAVKSSHPQRHCGPKPRTKDKSDFPRARRRPLRLIGEGPLSHAGEGDPDGRGRRRYRVSRSSCVAGCARAVMKPVWCPLVGCHDQGPALPGDLPRLVAMAGLLTPGSSPGSPRPGADEQHLGSSSARCPVGTSNERITPTGPSRSNQPPIPAKQFGER